MSVGCGVYPAERLGDFNVMQNLVIGREWLNPVSKVKKTLAEFENLMKLLTAAVSVQDRIGCACVVT